jgi:hypothetical protein
MNVAASGWHWRFQFGIYRVQTQTWVPIIVRLLAAERCLSGEKPGNYLSTKHQQTVCNHKNKNLENM